MDRPTSRTDGGSITTSTAFGNGLGPASASRFVRARERKEKPGRLRRPGEGDHQYACWQQCHKDRPSATISRRGFDPGLSGGGAMLDREGLLACFDLPTIG